MIIRSNDFERFFVYNSHMNKMKRIKYPIFLPDATRAVVRSVASDDLKDTGTPGVVVNTFHLQNDPGKEILENLGGVKQFMNWKGLVASDSGGFQVMSLVHAGKIAGKIVDDGVELRISKNKKEIFTPEKSIQMQFAIGPDIMFVLDDCPSNGANKNEVERSVDKTIAWAKRSRVEFDKQVKERKLAKNKRPLLFGVVQGANWLDLREKCEKELVEIGFDGLGFGGWPVDEHNNLNEEALRLMAELAPENYWLFGLGIGKPENVVACAKMGYDIFDCVLPTRDARHGRVYVFEDSCSLDSEGFYSYVYLSRGKYEQDLSPIETGCDCLTCQRYSRAYITHLFKIEDSLAWRLCTIHNLRFYARLMEKIRLMRRG